MIFFFQEGVTTSTSYGLALAKTVKFPRSVIKRANEIHQYLTSGENVRETVRRMEIRDLHILIGFNFFVANEKSQTEIIGCWQQVDHKNAQIAAEVRSNGKFNIRSNWWNNKTSSQSNASPKPN